MGISSRDCFEAGKRLRTSLRTLFHKTGTGLPAADDLRDAGRGDLAPVAPNFGRVSIGPICSIDVANIVVVLLWCQDQIATGKGERVDHGRGASGGAGNTAKRTTIYDIAEIAGTSPSAVSAVLNGTWKKRRISERLAERITRIAEEQGYALNLQASVLRRERSNIVGMIIPKYDNRYFGAIAEQFEARTRQRGLFPVITCTQRDPELEMEAARALVSYQVDWLIATGATDPDRISAFCTTAGVPTFNLDLPGSLAPSVVSDNFAGARALTRLIISRTRAEFGSSEPLYFIGGRPTDHNTTERLRGFRQAHAELGLEMPSERIITRGYGAEKAEAALEELNLPRQVGIFVNSTITLEGVVRWMQRGSRAGQFGVRFGCFDWDPFAARLPENVGMAEQDVGGMLHAVFEMIDAQPASSIRREIPCILRLPDHAGLDGVASRKFNAAG